MQFKSCLSYDLLNFNIWKVLCHFEPNYFIDHGIRGSYVPMRFCEFSRRGWIVFRRSLENIA